MILFRAEREPGVRTKLRPSPKTPCVLALAILASLVSVGFAQSPSSILPGPKPPDAPANWKRFVGIYEYSSYGSQKQNVIILERDQRAYMHHTSGPDEEIHFDLTSPYDFGQGYRRLGFMFVPDPAKGSWSYEIMEQPGAAPYFTYLMESYVRTDAGTDPAHFFLVTPPRPVAKLREEALKLSPPQEPGSFRKPDLVELAPLDPGIHLDIRYATANDFLGTPVYSQARAFLQRPAAEPLLRVQQKLKPLGYGLLIHDAYRPWYVTKIFWTWPRESPSRCRARMMKCPRALFRTIPAALRCSAGTAICCAEPWSPRDSQSMKPSGGTSITKIGKNIRF